MLVIAGVLERGDRLGRLFPPGTDLGRCSQDPKGLADPSGLWVGLEFRQSCVAVVYSAGWPPLAARHPRHGKRSFRG